MNAIKREVCSVPAAIQDVVLDLLGGLLGLAVTIFCMLMFRNIRRGRTLRRGEVKWQRK
jgi:mannose/fructose/N-acetylgalactosamine-specific phosphotransferase system component IID